MGKKKEVDDRFNKFGTVSFTAITKTNEFVTHLESGKVTGTKCLDCGAVFFPPRADCCHCLSSNMEWFDVSGNGRLVTFSKLTFAPIGFEDDVPYCIALLDYGNYKVFACVNDNTYTVIPWTASNGALNRGYDVVNRIKIEHDGSGTFEIFA